MGVVALLMAATLFGGNENEMGHRLGSTYDDSPRGISAIYQVLQETHGAFRWHKKPTQLPEDVGLLVVWQSVVPASSWEDLQQWVARGNTLVISARGTDLPVTVVRERDGLARSASVHPVGAGIGAVNVGPGAFADMDGAALVHLMRGHDTPVLVSWQHGNGRIYWSADSDWLTNRLIARSDNLDLALALLSPPEGKRVAFDEYHHGFVMPDRWWEVLRGPLRLWTLQFAVAVGLGFWAFGARFGSPRLEPASPPRAAVEYVYSMSNLYRRTRARPVALRAVYRELSTLLRRMVGAARDVTHAELARHTGPHIGVSPQEIERCLDSLAGDGKGLSDTGLLHLVREAEAIQRRVRHAGQRDYRAT